MATDKDTSEAVIQNLRDAGCDSEAITRFLQLYQNGKTGDQLYILTSHRKALLSEIHSEQSKLDCLDYLIYHIKKSAATKQVKGNF